MAIAKDIHIKQPVGSTGTRHIGADLLCGAAFLAMLLVLVWLAQYVAAAIIYLGEMMM